MSYHASTRHDDDGAAEQHRCPNSQCSQLFSSLDDICKHLSVPGSMCANWTQGFVNNLLHRGTVQPKFEHVEHDLDDYGEKCILLHENYGKLMSIR
jgi:hypothetical protein